MAQGFKNNNKRLKKKNEKNERNDERARLRFESHADLFEINGTYYRIKERKRINY